MKPFLPGSTIGLLGGGQLGRMFAIAGRKMGYRIHTFDPTPDCPTGQIADREVNRSFTDEDALRDFAKQVDVITYEFENIPVEPLKAIEGMVPLYPHPQVLHICQNRRREKEWLRQNGIPVAPFRVVDSLEGFKKAVSEIGFPSVLKTADFGYDGKGQQKLSASSDLDQVWKNLQAPVGVLEGWIPFQAELSVIVARNEAGEIKTFPVVRNHHENHILALSQVPAQFDSAVEKKATELAHRIAEAFGLIGLMAVECFLTPEEQILVNELAPRTHNSGHFSFDACVTSQFEQQLRAVCGLPLGSTEVMKPVIMRNILGDVWKSGTPAWDQLLALPGLKLHLYGKEEAKPGRKMGHYNVIGNSIEECLQIDQAAQRILNR
ncbi:MAG: 5-(carboxyamino)imidazole ribonucleotide synthase [Verrucomicrobiota bacterium]